MTEGLGVYSIHMDPGPSGLRVKLTTHLHLVSIVTVRFCVENL